MEQRFPFLHSLQDFSLERGKSRSFLIFLALSFFFWVITKFSNEYTEILTAEVRFDNFPMGIVPLSDPSSEVQITLTASGFQLLLYKLFDTSIVLAVDCLITPIPTIGSPLPRKKRRSSTTPFSTRATSPRRTR